MHPRIFLLLSILLPAGLACSGSGSGPTGGSGDGAIPGPGTGNGVDSNFTSKEPNDTPQHATPLGVASTGSVHVRVTSNTIGGSDTSDYFVFKSGATAGQFTFNICFSAPTTSMTATLWKVVGGAEQMPPVGTWTSTGTCVTDMTTPAALEVSTEYLLGLTARGGSSTYSAQ